MKIAVWGNELTAWVTAGALAANGNDVNFVSHSKINDPITLMGSSIRNEPGLRDLVCEEFEKKRMRFVQTRTALGIQTHILSMNPNEFEQACDIVSKLVNKAEGPLLIINQSHFGVGATDKLQALLNPRKKQIVAYFAENISEGEAIERIRHPKTLILGCDDDTASNTIQSLFRPFTTQLENLFVMSPKEAEFTKLCDHRHARACVSVISTSWPASANSSASTSTSSAAAMGSDPRIGRHHLAPGCGIRRQYLPANPRQPGAVNVCEE